MTSNTVYTMRKSEHILRENKHYVPEQLFQYFQLTWVFSSSELKIVLPKKAKVWCYLQLVFIHHYCNPPSKTKSRITCIFVHFHEWRMTGQDIGNSQAKHNRSVLTLMELSAFSGFQCRFSLILVPTPFQAWYSASTETLTSFALLVKQHEL